MYELILTVVVTFAHPVEVVDGHGVSMLSRNYEMAVQGFSNKEACLSYTNYTDLEDSLTSTFGADTKVALEAAPQCRPQSAAASNTAKTSTR
jgi:hypothetical protein